MVATYQVNQQRTSNVSVMQALQLLKFVKGVTKVYFGKAIPPHAKPLWKWLIQINEGGTPINFTIGRYQEDYLEKNPHVPKVFMYLYFLGYSWHSNNKWQKKA